MVTPRWQNVNCPTRLDFARNTPQSALLQVRAQNANMGLVSQRDDIPQMSNKLAEQSFLA